ncbi:hypothetical protein, partial [Frankia sp. KB5]|uniref:hypothetical protein n=1 Tax=Frankia sp. KB5 TaxID=683318 RepID=UPI000A258BF6
MTVVGTAEIVIIPSVRKFGDIGAKIQSQLSGVGMAATGVAGKFGTAEKAAAGVRGEVEAA